MPVPRRESRVFSGSQCSEEGERLEWLRQVIKGSQTLFWTKEMKLRFRDTTGLLNRVASGSPYKEWKKALILLGRLRGITISSLCQTLGTSKATICRHWNKFNELGTEGFFQEPLRRAQKAEDEAIKSAIFCLLHSPPSEHNINRTSWKLEDICRCLSQKGMHVSKHLVSKVIRGAGYKWRKAKMVLTSNDPEYREKLNRIKSVLSTLGKNDRFCSIDEYGPFAVKAKGGKRLVAPNEYPQIPEFQKSKGCLIVTAALELSQNQVTHFLFKSQKHGGNDQIT